jgi:transforming growth factor-beta-induced protein
LPNEDSISIPFALCVLAVFAPTDEAFDALPVGAFDSLKTQVNSLAAVLGYHTVRGNFTSADLSDGLELTTLSGGTLTVSIINGTVFVQGATVGPFDLLASNGVIHALDTVLLPPNFAFANNMVEAAIADPELKTLATAVVAAGLDDALIQSILTVFAPTDTAFDALPGGVLTYLLENVDMLSSVLLYHVAAGRTFSSDLVDGMEIETLLDQRENEFTVGIINGTVTINDTTVVAADITALNGVIHKIDGVLIPPDFVLPPNIYQTAVAAGGFDTLVTAIEAAGLVDALASDIFTVFAPTDAAFEALPEGALDYLLADAAMLADVLKYHVVTGETLAANLTDGMIATIDGTNSVTIAIVNGTVYVDSATIVDTDITALNGVIRAIDQVLLPPGFTLPPNIVEVASGEDDLTTLVTAVGVAGLADDLVQSILTVFAPIDSAFASLPAGVLDYLLENADMLTIVLLYHVAAGRTFSADLVDGMEIETLLDQRENEFTVGIINGTVTINDATVVAADITALNGVIHKIDGVLIPPDLVLPPNIYQTAVAADGFDTLVAAIDAAGLEDALAANILTVFAPTDDAFAALPNGVLAFLLANPDQLADVLLYHVLEGEFLSSEFQDGQEIATLLQGNSVTVSVVNETLYVNDAAIVGPNVTALNGVIHVIDKVLLPPDFMLPPNIAGLVETTDSLSTLFAALNATGLLDALSAEGLFTVFAPTDDAFAALPNGILASLLLEDDFVTLKEILLYHVVSPALVTASDIVEGLASAETLQGESVDFTASMGAMVNNATITEADISALNGFIHIIDEVLIPDSVVVVTSAPTQVASASPSEMPSESPSTVPSNLPSESPSSTPSDGPSETPSGVPSSLPTPVISASPTVTASDSPSLSPTPEPLFSFVVNIIVENQDWCLTAIRTSDNANLGFRKCDYDGTPDNQQWKFKNGQLISKINGGESRCAKVGFGTLVFSGIRIRLGECDDPLTSFKYNEDSKNIRTDTGQSLCLTNRGNNANTGDTIHAKTCINRNDYRWDFVVPP